LGFIIDPDNASLQPSPSCRLGAGSVTTTEELLKVQADLLQQLTAVQAEIAGRGVSDNNQAVEGFEGESLDGRRCQSGR
jgi:hypothetical protein